MVFRGTSMTLAPANKRRSSSILKSGRHIFKSLCTVQAWDLEDLQSVGFLKSDPSPQNTQSKPVLENTNMDIIDGETPMKKGVGVVTKHLKRRKVDVTVDKSVEAKRTPRNKKERRSFPVQRLPLESRTLYHGRTWLKVGLGDFTN